MHRIDTPTAQEGKFGAGKNGFTMGDPSLGISATQLDADFFDSVQEEIAAVIEGAGVTLQKADRAQLFKAINALIQAKYDLALLVENNLSDVDEPGTALANLNGVPKTTKVNGHSLMGDISVTSQDIFSGQVIGLQDAVDLNTITTPGLYFQGSNLGATNGANYPEPNAGSLMVLQAAGIIQIYTIYLGGATYTRTYYGGQWSVWVKQYDTANKPTADELGFIGGDVCRVGGFGAGNAQLPYLRHQTTQEVVYLARKDYLDNNFASVAWINSLGLASMAWVNSLGLASVSWVMGSFLNDLAWGGLVGIGIASTGTQVPAGCAVTGYVPEGDRPVNDTLYYRQLMKSIPSVGWVGIGNLS